MEEREPKFPRKKKSRDLTYGEAESDKYDSKKN